MASCSLPVSILERTLFDHLILSDQVSNKSALEDLHLRKLNSILSNLPFEIVKKSYDKVNQELYFLNHRTRNPQANKPKRKNVTKSKQHRKSLQRKKQASKSSLKPRPGSAQSNPSSFSSPSSTHFTNPNNQIVIHVCDEAKRLKQDFTCPRDLLVNEMKYFSYNLNINVTNSMNASASGAHAHSSVSQSALSKKTLDEIDISVHCDINIFDWLMRYVKRSHPYLIEKNIASSSVNSENSNLIEYTHETHTPKYIEPKLDFNNCVSILLSSDFLLMGELVDKCVLFIAKHLDSVLQVPCVMSGISEPLLVKLAACVNILKLNDVYDRKDKLKTKLFQRKLEFMFEQEKFKETFENSSILNDWKNNRYEKIRVLDLEEQDNYIEYLYECENDASSLFKCKLCSRLMTKQQSLNLKCQLTVLSKHGDFIYLHVPDDKLDLTRLLQLLKDKLKTWQNVYWFVWSLTKSFKCKKCSEWFRLVEMNRCRLNNNTFCELHDAKSSNSGTCSCIHCDHVLDSQSAASVYAKSPIVAEVSPYESPEFRLNKFIHFILEAFEKNREIILNGPEAGSEENSKTESTLCESIENILKLECQAKELNALKTKTTAQQSMILFESYFVDSITGRNISLMSKNMLNLVKLTQQQQNTSNESSLSSPNSNASLNLTNTSSLDLKSYLGLICRLDPVNIFNSLDVFYWLRVEPKMKWDVSKPTRLNQDNQREDDLKRFREISNYLIRTKLVNEMQLATSQRSPIATAMMSTLSTNNSTTNTNANSNNNNNNLKNNFIGGIYCRVENEWKQRNSS